MNMKLILVTLIVQVLSLSQVECQNNPYNSYDNFGGNNNKEPYELLPAVVIPPSTPQDYGRDYMHTGNFDGPSVDYFGSVPVEIGSRSVYSTIDLSKLGDFGKNIEGRAPDDYNNFAPSPQNQNQRNSNFGSFNSNGNGAIIDSNLRESQPQEQPFIAASPDLVAPSSKTPSSQFSSFGTGINNNNPPGLNAPNAFQQKPTDPTFNSKQGSRFIK